MRADPREIDTRLVAQSAHGLEIFLDLFAAAGEEVMLRVAHAGKRWFDRMVLSAPMIDLPGRTTALPSRAHTARGRLSADCS
jgi:alpha-beta hydrolase superfamily lysophospholipase